MLLGFMKREVLAIPAWIVCTRDRLTPHVRRIASDLKVLAYVSHACKTSARLDNVQERCTVQTRPTVKAFRE